MKMVLLHDGNVLDFVTPSQVCGFFMSCCYGFFALEDDYPIALVN